MLDTLGPDLHEMHFDVVLKRLRRIANDLDNAERS